MAVIKREVSESSQNVGASSKAQRSEVSKLGKYAAITMVALSALAILATFGFLVAGICGAGLPIITVLSTTNLSLYVNLGAAGMMALGIYLHKKADKAPVETASGFQQLIPNPSPRLNPQNEEDQDPDKDNPTTASSQEQGESASVGLLPEGGQEGLSNASQSSVSKSEPINLGAKRVKPEESKTHSVSTTTSVRAQTPLLNSPSSLALQRSPKLADSRKIRTNEDLQQELFKLYGLKGTDDKTTWNELIKRQPCRKECSNQFVWIYRNYEGLEKEKLLSTMNEMHEQIMSFENVPIKNSIVMLFKTKADEKKEVEENVQWNVNRILIMVQGLHNAVLSKECGKLEEKFELDTSKQMKDLVEEVECLARNQTIKVQVNDIESFFKEISGYFERLKTYDKLVKRQNKEKQELQQKIKLETIELESKEKELAQKINEEKEISDQIKEKELGQEKLQALRTLISTLNKDWQDALEKVAKYNSTSDHSTQLGRLRNKCISLKIEIDKKNQELGLQIKKSKEKSKPNLNLKKQELEKGKKQEEIKQISDRIQNLEKEKEELTNQVIKMIATFEKLRPTFRN